MSDHSEVIPAQRWFTIDEAALYLRISASTLRKILHAGELKAARLGPNYRLERTDLDQFLLKRKRVIAPYRKGTHPWVAKRHAASRKRGAR
jgi:excisionase family DNA binding protein